VKALAFPGGGSVPALGLGTWRMGESQRSKAAELAAVRLALDVGYRLIDTAEMYGEGGAETVVGEAVAAALRAGSLRREELFVVSKVYPHNASRAGTAAACERSRRRLGLDHIDLYLLHWRGQHPLRQTVEAFGALQEAGHIGRWGVSNFDLEDLQELEQVQEALGLPQGSVLGCASNQVYYSLSTRGPEFALLPWMRARGMPLMAYSPIDQGALCAVPQLEALAAKKACTPAQLALAWVVGQEGVLAIPKAVREAHLRDNLAAAHLDLSATERAQLDRLFPPPRRRTALAMI